MSRRAVLAAAELGVVAAASAAAVCGLVRAAYDPYAAVSWVPVAASGCMVALSLALLAAVLFVGRVALGAGADVVRSRRAARAVNQVRQVRRRGPVDGRHRAPVAPPMPTAAADLAEWGAYEYGGAPQ